MAEAQGTDIDARHGFVRADCQSCKNPDVWLTCNTCKKSDRFRVEGGIVCHCGAKYDHAKCTCGKDVPGDKLVWVPFEKGPLALADWEIDRGRLAAVVAGALIVLAVAGYGLARFMGWM